MLKAKDYARKQRDIIKQSNEAKLKSAVVIEHTHVHFKKELEVIPVNEVIVEDSEEQNESTYITKNAEPTVEETKLNLID